MNNEFPTGQKVLTVTVPVRVRGEVRGHIPAQLGLIRQRHTGRIGPLEDNWLEEPKIRPNRDATGHYLVEIGGVEKSVVLYHETELTAVKSNAGVAVGPPGAEQ